MKAELRDSRLFSALRFSDDNGGEDDAATMSGADVRFGTANELRLGKYCMINGFPCRIRDIQRSAPGKHGHAKLRVQGVGLFDQRKRETIFVAHQQVLIPTVETRSNVLCSLGEEEGYVQLKRNEASRGLPAALLLDDNQLPNIESIAELSICICCGHFHVTDVRPISQAEALTMEKALSTEGGNEEEPAVLSKKEQRRQRKLQRQQQSSSETE